VSEKILEWVNRLALHFGATLEDEQLKIFLHALKDNTTYQIEIAFDRCLNECSFMPKLAEVHERMPVEKWPRRDVGFVQQRPILDVVRDVVYEIRPDYDSMTDPKEIAELFARANRLRYERMGIDTRKWGDFEQGR